MTAKLEPLDDCVIVRVRPPESETKGGIYLPEVARRPTLDGEVLAVGPGRMNRKGNRCPMELEPGDLVRFDSCGGQTVCVGGEEQMIVQEQYIFARI